MEAYTVAELKQLAKENRISGYSKMRKQELIDALSKKPLKVSPGPKKDCASQPRDVVVQQAKSMGIIIGKKSREKLCNEIEGKGPSPKKAQKKAPKEKSSCESQLRAEIIEQAKSLGITIGKKTKAQLCDEISKFSKQIEACISVTPKEIDEFVDILGIDTENKSKNEICSEIVKNEPKKAPKKKAPKEKSSCESQLRAEIIEQAKSLGITIGKKTKAQLCDEISKKTQPVIIRRRKRLPSSPRRDISAQVSFSSDEWLNIVTQLTGHSYVSMTPEELVEHVSRADLLNFVEQNLKLSGTKGISALGLAYIIQDRIKEIGRLPEQRPQPRKTWNDIVFDLTGHRSEISPDDLPYVVRKGKLVQYARENMKLDLDLSKMSAINVARAMFDATVVRSSLSHIESVVSDNVEDAVVADALVDEIKSALSSENIAEKIDEKIADDPDINVDEAVDRVVEDVVEDVVLAAEQSGDISQKESSDILSEVVREEEEEIPERILSRKGIDRIEDILRELREPEAKASELASVQSRVYQLLGLM